MNYWVTEHVKKELERLPVIPRPREESCVAFWTNAVDSSRGLGMTGKGVARDERVWTYRNDKAQNERRQTVCRVLSEPGLAALDVGLFELGVGFG